MYANGQHVDLIADSMIEYAHALIQKFFQVKVWGGGAILLGILLIILPCKFNKFNFFSLVEFPLNPRMTQFDIYIFLCKLINIVFLTLTLWTYLL